LKEAVADYDRFVVTAPLGAGDVVPISIEEMADAHKRVTDAEAELWRLREELIGWVRPPSLPAATFVTDWFSEEDEVFDKMGEIDPTRL